MITFKDFIALIEGKQVGVLYHFTRIHSLLSMLETGFNLSSHQKYVSFTRNHSLVDYFKYSNDFSKDFIKGDRRVVRIVIDGDKLSNSYKIQPFIDTEHDVKRKYGENEEIVISDIVNITNSIKQIDIVTSDEFKDSIIEDLQKTKFYKDFKIVFVPTLKGLKPIR